MQGHQAEGRVGPGDQQVDGREIQQLEEAVGPALHLAPVKQRGGREQEDQGPAEDAEADHVAHIAAGHGQDDQGPHQDGGQDGGDPVGQGVGGVLAPIVGAGRGWGAGHDAP